MGTNPRNEVSSKRMYIQKEEKSRESQRPRLEPAQNVQKSPNTNVEDADESIALEPSLKTSKKIWFPLLSSSTPTIYLISTDSSERDIYLRREVGFISSVCFITSVTIGSEIFLASPVVLERAGSVFEALFVWILCGIFSLLVAVTYGELLFLVSQTGEKFSYLLTAFSPIHKFLGAIPAFLSIWIDGLFLAPAKVSLLALLVADNLYYPVATTLKTYVNFDVTEPVMVKQAIGMIVIVVITCINFRTIETLIRIQNTFGVLKMCFCCLVVGGGVYSIYLGNVDSFKSLLDGIKGNSTGILKATYKGMWTYEGWYMSY